MRTPQDAQQPDWYVLSVAAEALGGSAWDLHNLPEPDRTYWFNRGIVKNNAKAEADAIERGKPLPDNEPGEPTGD